MSCNQDRAELNICSFATVSNTSSFHTLGLLGVRYLLLNQYTGRINCFQRSNVVGYRIAKFVSYSFDRTGILGRKEGRKGWIYLTMPSVQFIYGYVAISLLRATQITNRNLLLPLYRLIYFVWKEGTSLFNDTFDTFYLGLYGIGHTNEIGNLLLPLHGVLFSISSKGSFICTLYRQDSTYHSLCYTRHGVLAGTK